MHTDDTDTELDKSIYKRQSRQTDRYFTRRDEKVQF